MSHLRVGDEWWVKLEAGVRTAVREMGHANEQLALRLFEWAALGWKQSVIIKGWRLVLLAALLPPLSLMVEHPPVSGIVAVLISGLCVCGWYVGNEVLRTLDWYAFDRLRQQHPKVWQQVHRVFQNEGFV
jgi:hypothetical protein